MRILAILFFLFSAVHAHATGLRFFPAEAAFRELIADPKEPKFGLKSWFVQSDRPEDAIGFTTAGHSFEFLSANFSGGRSISLGLSGTVYAQFDLLGESSDLINTDFLVGLPISFKQGRFSSRLKLYHQSSHLGDELLITSDIERINLSFETAEWLASWQMDHWRFYGGGQFILRRFPKFNRYGMQAGVEVQSDFASRRKGEQLNHRWIFGCDLKFFGVNSFTPSISAKGGVEVVPIEKIDRSHRSLRLILDAYYGNAPYGQFWIEDLKWKGFGFGFEILL